MSCEHEQDAGAYVLGALPTVERAAYERHLQACAACRNAVAELAVLPGLLRRLDPARLPSSFVSPVSSTPPPRRRRSRIVVLVAAAFLLLASGAYIITGGVSGMVAGGVLPGGRGRTVAMRPLDDDLPISARITLSAADGGTRIDLVCEYARDARYTTPYIVELDAYGPPVSSEAGPSVAGLPSGPHSGGPSAGGPSAAGPSAAGPSTAGPSAAGPSAAGVERVASWVATPGQRFVLSGVTRFAPDEVSRLALARDDGTVLLVYDVP